MTAEGLDAQGSYGWHIFVAIRPEEAVIRLAQDDISRPSPRHFLVVAERIAVAG
jgi:hypothetical protein